MKGKKLFRSLAFTAAIASLAMSLGCGEGKEEVDDRLYVAVIAKGSNSDYWDTVKKGSDEAGEEMNVRTSFSAPSGQSVVDSQKELVNQAVADGANAIVIAPISYDAINDALEAADKAGVPILTIDSDTSFANVKAKVTTNNDSAGAIAAMHARDIIGGKGKIAIINHSEEMQTTTRINGFTVELTGKTIEELIAEGSTEELKAGREEAQPEDTAQTDENTDDENADEADDKKEPEPDGIRIIENIYCGGVQERAKEETMKLISEHPDLKLIYSTNEPATIGVCQGIEEMHAQDQVQVVGFDCPFQLIKCIEDGTLDGTIVQDPYTMGYNGVTFAMKIAGGSFVDPMFDTGATFVNSENINSPYVQKLIYPLGK